MADGASGAFGYSALYSAYSTHARVIARQGAAHQALTWQRKAEEPPLLGCWVLWPQGDSSLTGRTPLSAVPSEAVRNPDSHESLQPLVRLSPCTSSLSPLPLHSCGKPYRTAPDDVSCSFDRQVIHHSRVYQEELVTRLQLSIGCAPCKQSAHHQSQQCPIEKTHSKFFFPPGTYLPQQLPPDGKNERGQSTLGPDANSPYPHHLTQAVLWPHKLILHHRKFLSHMSFPFSHLRPQSTGFQG